MANGGWEGFGTGALAGGSMFGPLGFLGGGILGFFTDIFGGGGPDVPVESEELRRLRQQGIQRYMQMLESPTGYSPQALAEMREYVAQQEMTGERDIAQRTSRFLAGRGLLDSGTAAAEYARRYGGLEQWGAGQRAAIQQADYAARLQQQQLAMQGLQGYLGQMSDADLARYNAALQREQAIGQLWGQGISGFLQARTPEPDWAQFINAGLPIATTPATTPAITPATPGQPAPYIQGPGYGTPGPPIVQMTSFGQPRPLPQYNVGQQVSSLGVGQRRPLSLAPTQTGASSRYVGGTRNVATTRPNRSPWTTIRTINPIYRPSRRWSNNAQRV